MDTIDFKKKYDDLFSENSDFQETYLVRRMQLYKKIVSLLVALNVKKALDIGCAYGLLVEEALENGIDAWGLDLPIEALKKKHSKLKLSSNRFLYGDIEDAEILSKIIEESFDAIILLDTIRSLRDIKEIGKFGPKIIIIKDACDNSRNRRKSPNSILSIKLYGPHELLNYFPFYKIKFLYPSKFLIRFKNPSLTVCKIVNNAFPTYCAILEKID